MSQQQVPEQAEVKSCSICSVVYEPAEPGLVVHLDERKWLFSPIPCPECTARSHERLKALGASLAAERESRIYQAILEG